MNDTTAYIKLQAMLELVRELKEEGGYAPEFLMEAVREKLEVKCETCKGTGVDPNKHPEDNEDSRGVCSCQHKDE